MLAWMLSPEGLAGAGQPDFKLASHMVIGRRPQFLTLCISP